MLVRRAFSAATLLALCLTAACQQARPDSGAVERIDLDAPIERTNQPRTGLPDATGAGWELVSNGKSLRFANPAGEPLLSLACEVPAKEPPRIRFLHYAAAPPGAKALFAMVGNLRVARIGMDARQQGKRWVWTGTEPADAPKLEALMGTNKVIATMPGGGEIELAGSSLPRQFIEQCRAKAKPAASPSPAPTA